MKIRNGFVSNSSSSSFIIRGGEESVGDIATSMLNIVIEDFTDWNDKPTKRNIYNTWKKNLKAALKRPDVKSGKIGIVMPSCNYDTYIIQKDDTIYISTANNHTWDINATDIEYDDGKDYESLRNVIEDSFFFDIRNKIIHSHERYEYDDNRVCPKCKKTAYGFVVNKKGQNICPMCYKGVLTKTAKQIDEEKAKKLLENPPKSDAISSLEV